MEAYGGVVREIARVTRGGRPVKFGVMFRGVYAPQGVWGKSERAV